MNKGVFQALLAYVFWGLFPLFWRQLIDVEAFQLVSHRVVWSFVLLVGFALFTFRIGKTDFFRISWSNILIYSIAGLLIGINWFLYVWAVNSGHIIECSLGYFINPLFSVLLGVIFFNERLRTWQWIPLGLAAAGVLYLSLAFGSVPWIAITLATSFSLYGMVKKKAHLQPVQGLIMETSVLLLPSLIFLIMREQSGTGAFLHMGTKTDILLISGGLVTTIPLILFASAVRKISLSMIGMLQYVSPTLQFLCGVLIYGEEFTRRQFVGYGLVWFGLLLFAIDSYLAHRRRGVALE